MRQVRRALLGAIVLLVSVAPAGASVVEHVVTPASDPSLPGVDVVRARRPDGTWVFTITVQRAPNVYPVRVSLGSAATPVPFRDPRADPLVARVEIPPSASQAARITVMRDFGLVGHHYVIPVNAWTSGP
ncbi:MAG: hypothetical protein AAGE52_17420 [Myxococcota bacterium]